MLSAAGALNVQVLSLCMDMTNWAESGRSFTLVLEKLNVKGIGGEQQPMLLLEGREKKGLAAAENEVQRVKQQGQGLTLSVRLSRTEQQHSIEKVSMSNDECNETLTRPPVLWFYLTLDPSNIVC